MVDISSQNNKINVTVSSSGNTANTNVTPDYAQYYSEKSKENADKAKEWATSDKIVDNEDYSSKYYANESKKQADISTAKTTEVIESGNTAVSNIENARDNAITDITNQESLSVDNVNTAGVTQVANVNSEGTIQINLAKEQVTLATNQANIATEQATIATNKASEVVASGNEALSNIDTAKTGALTDITDLKNTSISDITTAKNNAITSITNQETTSKNVLIDEGATQVGLIQNEGATQIANVQSTGFYMKDDKLYYINSQGQETEFKLDDIELNNPYSLFDSKYSDHELNNLSWLKSEGQWNAKAVYTDAYDKLLKVYNGTETVEGLSVKLSTEIYIDYDFVLNTADETFRLPLKNHTADDSIEGLTLYFYVGETVQNANLIDAGRIGEQLANKIGRQECKAYITETYQNGTSWYRVYSDGWCEQGGYSTSSNVTIKLLKTYANTDYTITLGKAFNTEINSRFPNIVSTTKTTAQFKVTGTYSNKTGTDCYFYWETKGYMA